MQHLTGNHPKTDCKARLDPERLAIFLFHGVIEKQTHEVRNYNRKHLEADYFRSILRELRETGTPLSADDVIEFHREGRAYPPGAYLISFDDGFENNLSVAAPLLEEFDTPAVFYLTSKFVDENAMSWIDRIEHCLESVPKGALQLPWNEGESRFASPQEKIVILDEIRRRVKSDASIDADSLIASIYRQCGLPEVFASNDPLDQKLTWEQVAELAAHPLFAVGGHSHTHSILSFLSPEELRNEIRLSLKLLEERGGLRTRHYSYPEGLEHCYSDAVIAELKAAGIEFSPTAIDGLNAPGDDLFHLRRILVT